jgi:hypothetical protein
MSTSSNQWTGDKVERIAMNPFYAITLHPDLFGDHDPLISREQWIDANARLVEQLGAKQYLSNLLDTLAGDFPRQPDSGDHS